MVARRRPGGAHRSEARAAIYKATQQWDEEVEDEVKRYFKYSIDIFDGELENDEDGNFKLIFEDKVVADRMSIEDLEKIKKNIDKMIQAHKDDELVKDL